MPLDAPVTNAVLLRAALLRAALLGAVLADNAFAIESCCIDLCFDRRNNRTLAEIRHLLPLGEGSSTHQN